MSEYCLLISMVTLQLMIWSVFLAAELLRILMRIYDLMILSNYMQHMSTLIDS